MFFVKDVIKIDLRNKLIYPLHWQPIAEELQPGERLNGASTVDIEDYRTNE